MKVGGDATQSVENYVAVRTVRGRRSTFTYDDGQSGQTAHYLVRYLTRDDSTGPWSQVVSTTIAAAV